MKRYKPFFEDQDDISIGDIVLTGKFKNKRAIVKGFGTDKNNQPTIITDKGEMSLYHVRIDKKMKEGEHKVELFTRFIEDVHFSDLMYSQSIGDFTKKYAKETNKLMGNATNHIKLIQMKYSKKKDFVIFFFVTERTPKYDDNFHLQAADPKDNFKLKKDNLYTIQIKVLNFFSLLGTTPNKVTNKDIEDVFNVASIQWYSDVPFFHWGGCNWALSLLDGSIYPTTIAPKFWQKYTNNDSFLDKHSANLANSIKFYIPQMRQMVHKIATKKQTNK